MISVVLFVKLILSIKEHTADMADFSTVSKEVSSCDSESLNHQRRFLCFEDTCYLSKNFPEIS